MNAHREPSLAVPSENWDEDFEFQQSHTAERVVTRKQAFVSSHYDTPDPRRISTASSFFNEDFNFNHEIQRPSRSSTATVFEDKKNYYPASTSPTRPRLADWSESAPSTPTKRPNPENWDDDFEDKTDSPSRKILSHPLETYRGSQRRDASSRTRRRHPSESENWDDLSVKDNSWKQSDASHVKRMRHGTYTDSSDDDVEFGFAETNDDKTVTARSRPRVVFNNHSPPPPVPALPTSLLGHDPNVEQMSRSPTESFFSIPTSTGRSSVTQAYSSTTNLALRRRLSGASSTLALLPPSPPIHRERRRLRKKSRPPHLDNNIFELQDRGEPLPPSSLPPQPSSPERSASPPPSSERLVSPNSSKVPLISRIGSVKKWGVRRKRASTAPSEVMQEVGNGNETTPRPPSALSHTSPSNKSGNWFFRTTGGGPETGPLLPRTTLNGKDKNTKSDHSVETTQESPSTLHKRKSLGFVNLRKMEQPPVEDPISHSPLPSKPRRPSSMQPHANPRHVSYSHEPPSLSSTPVTRSASGASGTGSASVEDLGRVGQREGSRTFMRGIRKISLVGGGKKHERTKSFSETEPTPTLPVFLAPAAVVSPTVITQPNTLLPASEHHPPSVSQLDLPIVPPTSQSSLLPESHASASVKAIASSESGGITVGNLNTPTKALPLPQTASLGRSTPPSNIAGSTSMPRRNSLGDLKIPTRISQAQVGLRNDLSMVREFATNVEQLKRLEITYAALTAEVQALTGSSHASSPALVHPLPLPGSSPHPNTNIVSPQPSRYLASAFDTIISKYLIAWECAQLLIELGSGTKAQASSPPVSVSAPVLRSHSGPSECKKNRERAITLAGDESKPIALASSPPSTSTVGLTRSVTERHELNRRQLVLLKEILNSTDASFMGDFLVMEDSAPNRDWRWGDAMNSTVTLPSEDSQGAPSTKKRRTSRLGMSGLRDVLRSLKRSPSDQPMPLPHRPPPVDPSTDSSLHCQHRSHHPRLLTHRRREKTSTGPESIHPTSSLKQNSSPRRPSLASIFRLGQKNKSSNTEIPNQSVENIQSIASRSSGRDSCSITDEGDWDRIDSTSDLDSPDATKRLRIGAVGSSTIRGHSSCINDPSGNSAPLRVPGALRSQSSINTDSVTPSIPEIRSTPLSNVDESPDVGGGSIIGKNMGTHVNSSRPTSRMARRGVQTGSIRSAPPPSFVSSTIDSHTHPLDPNIALMPENIKPLLDNSREVLMRLQACIDELHRLLAGFRS